MAYLLDSIPPLGVSDEDIPHGHRETFAEGWTQNEDGALLVTSLWNSYFGDLENNDPVHTESTVNGRAMMDHDLPNDARERLETLLRRSVSYACAGIRSSLEVAAEPTVRAYISVSESAEEHPRLTAHVTFCTHRANSIPYIEDIESFTQEGILELGHDDLSRFTLKK
ncbi:hypothetical protein [Streptomyces sp. NPDC054784]